MKQPIQRVFTPCSPHTGEYTLAVDGNLVVLEDLDQGPSITNTAEVVVKEVANALALQGLDINRFTVIYRDTMGIWDEIKVEESRFAGFAPIQKWERPTDYERARKLVAARQLPLTGGIC